MIVVIVTAGLLLSMALAIIRAVRGPTVFERVTAANTFNTKTLLLIAVMGFLFESPADYLDIALLYGAIGFIGTVAVLSCVEYGGFRRSGDEADE